jgi:hypothetical protein
MGRMPWTVYLWPGLPQVMRDARWSALWVALGSAFLLNLALSASLLWSELFAPGVRTSVWMAVAVLWVGWAAGSYLQDGRSATSGDRNAGADAFAEAMSHYLKEDWFEAERVLHGLLKQDPRDLEAGLMLATLWRRTGRLLEAEKELDRLGRFESSRKWELEIRRERELLDEAFREAAPVHGPAVDVSEPQPPVEMADAA